MHVFHHLEPWKEIVSGDACTWKYIQMGHKNRFLRNIFFFSTAEQNWLYKMCSWWKMNQIRKTAHSPEKKNQIGMRGWLLPHTYLNDGASRFLCDMASREWSESRFWMNVSRESPRVSSILSYPCCRQYSKKYSPNNSSTKSRGAPAKCGLSGLILTWSRTQILSWDGKWSVVPASSFALRLQPLLDFNPGGGGDNRQYKHQTFFAMPAQAQPTCMYYNCGCQSNVRNLLVIGQIIQGYVPFELTFQLSLGAWTVCYHS